MQPISRFNFLSRAALVLLLAALGSLAAHAHATGKPMLLTFDPPAVRQGSKPSSQVTAIVVLQSASPAFFVCQVRSQNDPAVHFESIVFAKGQTVGKAAGIVRWNDVLKDTSVKISAFSSDQPDLVVTGTLTLRVAEEEAPESE